jgi:hypothetical protein
MHHLRSVVGDAVVIALMERSGQEIEQDAERRGKMLRHAIPLPPAWLWRRMVRELDEEGRSGL